MAEAQQESPASTKKFSPSSFLASVRAGDEGQVTKELSVYGTSLFDVADKNGRMCLHVAAREGHIRLVEIMTWNKYDLNTPNTGSGQTALHEAADKGHIRMLHYLIAKGADPMHAGKDGLLPIHVAAREGNNMCLSVLAAAGSDINAATVSGYLPAHYAAAKGRLDTLRVLKKLGSPLFAKANDGSLPTEFAKANKHFDCVEFLEQCAKEEDGSLPDIESRQALEAKLKAAQDKVASVKEKSKALLHSKHEDWVTHMKTIKTQHSKKIEALHQELSEKLEEAKEVQSKEMEEMQAIVDEQQMVIGEFETVHRDCRCGLSWPATTSVMMKLDNRHLPTVTKDKASPQTGHSRLNSLSRQKRVDSASSVAKGNVSSPKIPVVKVDEGMLPPQFSTSGRGTKTVSFDDGFAPDSLPILSHPISLGGRSPGSVMDAPPSPGIIRSPRVSRGSGGGMHRVDTPAPGFSTPPVNRGSGNTLRADSNQLKSPSLSDLHQLSLNSEESMHTQKKLLELDTMKASPLMPRRSPLAADHQAAGSGPMTRKSNTTSPIAAAPNSGRSPGSLPHMSDH